MRLGAREILFLMVILGVLASSYFLIFSKANAKLEATKEDTLAKEHALADLRTETSGIADLNRKIDQLETTANYSEEPIELTVSGDYKGFYQFMLDLEKLPRLTRVTQMKLTKMNGDSGQMAADVTLSIYFAPDVQSSASAQ